MIFKRAYWYSTMNILLHNLQSFLLNAYYQGRHFCHYLVQRADDHKDEYKSN